MRELNGRPPYPLPRARAVARGRSPHLSRLAGGEVEFARSSRKFRVRGPLHEAELWGESEFVEPPPRPRQPPVTLMCRATAGRLWRRSITKSWPLGLRVIASSMAS